MKLSWGAKVVPEFANTVISICKQFNWPLSFSSYLMACIAFETRGTFSSHIRNAAGSGATGLIQWTSAGLDHTNEVLRSLRLPEVTLNELAAMSPVEQLDYVAAYFIPYANTIQSLADMYMAILAPVAIGKPDDTVLYSSGRAYRLNAALDADNDGKITKAEAVQPVAERLARGLGYGYWSEVLDEDEDTARILQQIRELLVKLEARCNAGSASATAFFNP